MSKTHGIVKDYTQQPTNSYHGPQGVYPGDMGYNGMRNEYQPYDTYERHPSRYTSNMTNIPTNVSTTPKLVHTGLGTDDMTMGQRAPSDKAVLDEAYSAKSIRHDPTYRVYPT